MLKWTLKSSAGSILNAKFAIWLIFYLNTFHGSNLTSLICYFVDIFCFYRTVMSNHLLVLIDAPVCMHNSPQVLGAQLEETLRVRCSVTANPPDVTFFWQFNNSGESLDVSPTKFGKNTHFYSLTSIVYSNFPSFKQFRRFYLLSLKLDYYRIICTLYTPN